jgi:hypothetical protein
MRKISKAIPKHQIFPLNFPRKKRGNLFRNHSPSTSLKHFAVRFTFFATRKRKQADWMNTKKKTIFIIQDILLSLSPADQFPTKGSILLLYCVASQEEALHRHGRFNNPKLFIIFFSESECWSLSFLPSNPRTYPITCHSVFHPFYTRKGKKRDHQP